MSVLDSVKKNQWTTTSLGIPDWATTLQQGISTSLTAVSAGLSATQIVANTTATYAFNVEEAVEAVLKAFREQIISLSKILANTGIYVHGDWHVLEQDARGLIGGYPAWLSRMQSRLRDVQDPDFPDFGPEAKILGVFLYASVPDIERSVTAGLPPGIEAFDFSRLADLQKFMDSVKTFVGVPTTGSVYVPPVEGLKAVYGFEGEEPFLDTPEVQPGADTVQVSWKLGKSKTGAPPVEPYDFVVQISTRPDPYPVYFRQRSADPADSGYLYEIGQVLDKAMEPITLFGGYQEINMNPFSGIDRDELDIFIYPDPATDSRLSLRDLKVGDKPLYQETFYVDGASLWSSDQDVYRVSIPRRFLPWVPKLTQDINHKVTPTLPNQPEQPSQFYVRVLAVRKRNPTTEVKNEEALRASKNLYPVVATPYYHYEWLTNAQDGINPVQFGIQGTDGASLRSLPLAIAFDPYPVTYRDSIALALALGVLMRADLGEQEDDKAIARVLPMLTHHLGTSLKKWLQVPRGQAKFRQELWNACLAAAQRITVDYPLSPQEALATGVIAAPLLNWTTSNMNPLGMRDGSNRVVSYPGSYTLKELLAQDDSVSGIAQSCEMIDPTDMTQPQLFGAFGEPQISAAPPLFSIPDAPVLFWGLLGEKGLSPTGTAVFPPMVIPQDVYHAAAQLLLVVAGQADNPGGWVKLSAGNWAPWADQFTASMLDFADAGITATQGVSRLTASNRRLLEVKIQSLQALVNQLDATLAFPLRVNFSGKISALFVLGNSVGDVSLKLTQAAEPPPDGTSYQSAGVVILVGAIPNIGDMQDQVLTLFKALFGG